MIFLVWVAFVFGIMQIGTSYSSGPAATQQDGFTGAPCESGLTCGGCHRGSLFFGNTLEYFYLIDIQTGDTAQLYIPGRSYKAYVQVFSPGNAPFYGFQATALDTTNVSAGQWSSPGRDTQISDANVFCETERVYIEHDKISNVDTFSAIWKAPLAYQGDVVFYFVGNAVNGDKGTTGDRGGMGSSKRYEAQLDSTIIYTFPNDSIKGHYLSISAFKNAGTIFASDSAFQSAPDYMEFCYPFTVELNGVFHAEMTSGN